LRVAQLERSAGYRASPSYPRASARGTRRSTRP
jgi:hypothetical protein